MLYTSEQFANKQFMENHDDVAQRVTSRQTDRQTDRQKDRRERQAAAAAPTTTSTCVKPADSVNMTFSLDDLETRSQKTKTEIQNDAMHDRGPERREG